MELIGTILYYIVYFVIMGALTIFFVAVNYQFICEMNEELKVKARLRLIRMRVKQLFK